MKKISSLFLVPAVILLSVFAMGATAFEEELGIYENTLRLHIPACSDLESDQTVKLKVRDAVLELLSEPLSECKSKDDAVNVVLEMREEIESEADRVLEENGKSYRASVSVVKEHYPEKDYGELTLPAGTYTSLKIELGKAEGKNWWCVLFPQVCVGSARPTEALAEVGFTANQIKLLTDEENGGYVVKFKILEILSEVFG